MLNNTNNDTTEKTTMTNEEILNATFAADDPMRVRQDALRAGQAAAQREEEYRRRLDERMQAERDAREAELATLKIETRGRGGRGWTTVATGPEADVAKWAAEQRELIKGDAELQARGAHVSMRHGGRMATLTAYGLD